MINEILILEELMENNDRLNSNKKQKFDFQKTKENTVQSLFEVEHFLCNLQQVTKGIRLFHILKK